MALLYLQLLPNLGSWQEGSLRLFLTSLLPLPPNKGHKLSL